MQSTIYLNFVSLLLVYINSSITTIYRVTVKYKNLEWILVAWFYTIKEMEDF